MTSKEQLLIKYLSCGGLGVRKMSLICAFESTKIKYYVKMWFILLQILYGEEEPFQQEC